MHDRILIVLDHFLFHSFGVCWRLQPFESFFSVWITIIYNGHTEQREMMNFQKPNVLINDTTDKYDVSLYYLESVLSW
jgi:hypothetical protein